MEALIAQLQNELNIPEKEAVAIIKAITEYVEKQHPLLKDLAQELMKKEIEKTKNAKA